jgi:hypothetical protein
MGPIFDKPLVAVTGDEIRKKIDELKMFIEYLEKELGKRTGDGNKF